MAEINISLEPSEQVILDEAAGTYTQYIIWAGGIPIAHFLNPIDRQNYIRMLMKEGLNGFPENIMKHFITGKKKMKVNSSLPELSAPVLSEKQSCQLLLNKYKVVIEIYENIVFDRIVGPYPKFVVAANNFVIASFLHYFGAVAYMNYLQAKGFINFDSSVKDVISYYSRKKQDDGKKIQ